MQRVDAPEILDSESCPPEQVQPTLQTLDRINRWFGGVSGTQAMVERASAATGAKHFSLLEVAAGSGKLPELVQQQLGRSGITLDVTLLDRARSHLPGKNTDGGNRISPHRNVVADGLTLPFGNGAFDLVSCNLFAHHLNPDQLAQFAREGLRVSRRALLINDLVRHPLHLALVYASSPIMATRVAWLDGLTSVRRAYVPEEIRGILASAFSSGVRVEISRHFLFRMAVIVWKGPAEARSA